MNLPAGYEMENPTATSALPPGYEMEEGPGQLETFGRAAANNFPLAPQAIAGGEALLGDKGYSQNLEEWNAKAKEAKEAHPITYGAGAVTGAAAPLLIPGVGEALEASPIAGNALLGAANAVSNKDLTKDAGDTLKDVAAGAAIGGGLGAAGQGISKLLEAGSPAAERLSANATANALDLGTFGVKKLARAGQNPEEVLNEINDDLQEHLPGFIKLGDTAGSKFSKLSQAHDAAGDVLGSVVDSVSQGTAGKLPEAQEAINELKAAAADYGGLNSTRAIENKAELDDAAAKLEALAKSNKLTFRNLADLKTDIGRAYHNPNLDNQGIDKAYGILTKKIDGVLDRVGVEDPAIKPSYDKAKAIYRLTSRLIPAMQRGVSREVAGTGGGLMNAALGAGALFHPIPAAAAFAGKTALKLGAPDLVQNATYKLMNAAGPVGARGRQAAMQELNDFLASKYANKGVTNAQ